MFAKVYRTMTSGRQGPPYFRRYGRELVSKLAISLKKSWVGYRRTTLFQEVPAVPRRSRRRFNPLQRLEVEQITGHQSVRGRGGVIAVLYKTHWAGLSKPSWERKWTSTSPTPTSCVIGPEPRTSTAKPTAFTAECGSGRQSVSSPATMGNIS